MKGRYGTATDGMATNTKRQTKQSNYYGQQRKLTGNREMHHGYLPSSYYAMRLIFD
jgi:hypothetical protein